MDALTDATEVLAVLTCGVYDCFGGPCDSTETLKCYVTKKYRMEMPDFEMACRCTCHGERKDG